MLFIRLHLAFCTPSHFSYSSFTSSICSVIHLLSILVISQTDFTVVQELISAQKLNNVICFPKIMTLALCCRLTGDVEALTSALNQANSAQTNSHAKTGTFQVFKLIKSNSEYNLKS